MLVLLTHRYPLTPFGFGSRLLISSYFYLLLPPQLDMLKVRRFLAYLLLGYIIGLCHLLFFVDGRAVQCFLDDFNFLGIGIGRLFSLLWIGGVREFCCGGSELMFELGLHDV